MISAEPMPHELAVAHQGRIYWLNGCLHEDDLQRLLNRALVERGYDSKGMRRLHQLALVSGMDIGEYTRRHSMLPMDCIATFDGNERSENPVLMNDKPDRPGMPLYRSTVAYCCHECITEDLQKRQGSRGTGDTTICSACTGVLYTDADCRSSMPRLRSPFRRTSGFSRAD
jgi:hypothetical protein